MKSIITLLAITLFSFLSLQAQEGNDKIESLKIAYITKRLQN